MIAHHQPRGRLQLLENQAQRLIDRADLDSQVVDCCQRFVVVSGSKMTSRGNRYIAIVAEQTAEACAVLDPTTGCMHRIVAGRWGS